MIRANAMGLLAGTPQKFREATAEDFDTFTFRNVLIGDDKPLPEALGLVVYRGDVLIEYSLQASEASSRDERTQPVN